MEIKAHITPNLNICLLLSDLYDPNMPARPAVREIYGNCFPHMGDKVTWIMPAKAKIRKVQERYFGEVRILLIPCHQSSSFLIRTFSRLPYLWQMGKVASRIIREERVNLIQARTSVFEGLLATYLKRRFRIPFVFQYSFPITEKHQQKHKIEHSNLPYLIVKLWHFVLSFILRRADLILPISEGLAKKLAEEGVPRRKMVPLPLGVNTELFSPSVTGEEIRAEYGLNGFKIIIYLGTMDKMRQLDILVYSLAKLKQAREGVKLLMVGEGNGKDNLEKLVHALGLGEDVVFTGQVPYLKVPAFIAAADVTMSPVPPLEVYKVSSPCKLFEYMGVAKPVVANEEIPEHKRVIEQSGGGILVPFTPKGFANAIIELLDNPGRANEMGQKGREWVVKNRSYEILARRIEKEYYQLLRKE